LIVGRLALEGIEPDILCWSIENVKTIESSACVYIGSDNQSFFNLSMSIKSGWQLFDPQSNEKCLKEIAPLDTRWLRRRMFCVEKCKDAQSIGIVVGTLTTKGYLDIVERIKTLAKQREIRSYLLSVGKVNPAKLANFMEIDCFVLVGCPENTIYTSRDFYKPLVSVFEIEMALNPAWHSQFPETYCTDFRELLPEGRLFKDSSVAENSEATRDNDMSLVTGRVRVLNSQKMDFESTTLTMAEKSNNELVISSADTFTDRSWQGLNPELGKHEPALVQQGRKGIAMKYDNDPSMET
jgi:diphthamide biosynthesis protein 2